MSAVGTGALQRGHHGLEVRAAGYFGYHTAKTHMELDAGGHLVGKQLMAPNNAHAGLVAGGLDAEDEWPAAAGLSGLLILPPS